MKRLFAILSATVFLAQAQTIFAGLNTNEAAEALGISVRSAHDLWAYARSWLHQKMSPE